MLLTPSMAMHIQTRHHKDLHQTAVRQWSRICHVFAPGQEASVPGWGRAVHGGRSARCNTAATTEQKATQSLFTPRQAPQTQPLPRTSANPSLTVLRLRQPQLLHVELQGTAAARALLAALRAAVTPWKAVPIALPLRRSSWLGPKRPVSVINRQRNTLDRSAV
jgi:hypothetical protein